MNNIIDGRAIAAVKEKRLRKRIERLSALCHVPSLVSIQIGHDDNSKVYLDAQKKKAGRLGIKYVIKNFEDSVSYETLAFNIDRFNKDENIDAMILQTPLPSHLDYNDIVRCIDPAKDVEGTHPYNIGRLSLGCDELAPPTAKAVIDIIESVDYDLYGKDVVVVGNSPIVGRPLSTLLLRRMATVTVAHIATSKKNRLEHYLSHADVVIVAVGRSELVKGESLKKGSFVIDVGINWVNGVITGDVEFSSAVEKALYITPVPGGVGSVTSAVLMENAVLLAERKCGSRN